MGANQVRKSINLFDLPLDSTYVLLSKKVRNTIETQIAENDGIDKISKSLEIKRPYFYRFFQGRRCSLYFLSKLIGVLDMATQEIEKNIIFISSGKNNPKGITNPKLPFRFDNSDGGTLLGGIMGDGSRTKLGGLTYNNCDETLVNAVLDSAIDIFGNINQYLVWKKDGTLQLYLPKIAGDAVGLFGIQKSYKTLSDCYVELNGFSYEFKTSFIRQFFDDEGNVRTSDRRVQIKQTRVVFEKDAAKIRKNVESYTPRVLLTIDLELKRIGLRPTVSLETLRSKNGIIKGDFALSLYGKDNLIIFREKINFGIVAKKELLDKVIKNYKFPSAPRNGRIQFALEKARVVQKRDNYITKHTLALECKRSLKTATYFLVDLKKMGLVKIIEAPRNEFGKPLPWKYLLTKKSKDL